MTVVAVGVLIIGCLIAVALAGIGQLAIARTKAVTAAEAGALAAAPVTFRPFGTSGSPRAEADRLVRANGAVLVRCICPYDSRYDSRTVTVTARIRVAVLGFREVTLDAVAAAEFSPVALLDGLLVEP